MVLKDAWAKDVTAKFENIKEKTELIINGRMRSYGRLQPISTFYSGAELVTYQQVPNC
jgi:hypothetical protein